MNEDVLDRIDRLVARADDVIRTHKENPPNVIGFPTLDSGAFAGWRSQALALLEQLLGPQHTYVRDFQKHVERGFRSHVQQGQAILKALREDIQQSAIRVGNDAVPTVHLETFDTLDTIASRFHVIACQLRARYDDRATLDVTDEYDVQDLLHALLRLFFQDVRPEEWTPSYAGKSSRVDFLLKPERTVVETKKSRPRLGAKEIGSQLIEDIARYEKHPDCDQLFCLVYDPDHRITNPRGLEADLRRDDDGFRVRVRVVPQGY
jgi:hypothetical protein